MSTQTQSESITGSPPKGSLQSLNFGMFSVDQLATLINWGNDSDYKPPICNPWVKIDLAEEPSPHAPIKQPAAQATSAEAAAESPAEPPSGDVEAEGGGLNDAAETESSDVVASAQDVSPEHAAASPDAEQSVTVKPAAESVAESTSDAVREAAAEASAGEHAETDSAAVEVAAAPAAESGNASGMLGAAGGESVQEAVAEAVEEVASPPDRDASVDVAAAAADSIRAAAVSVAPTPRPSFAKPMIMKQARQQRPPMSDDYLKRLESLVLELNMQLARLSFEGEDSGADYTQWLSQRVIDLSLENMSLQEELQKLR